MGITSYAQNFEDVMLWRALAHIEGGFYIDIGAQDPVVDSVSLSFYERGWRGIHVEPVADYAALLRQARSGDVVIQSAVGMGPSVPTFFEISGSGISTADADIAAGHAKRGMEVRETHVPCVPLCSVFELVAPGSEVHWLKIDVEGSEESVLRSWGPAAIRPWIVLVESTIPLTQTESYSAWEPLLLARGYQFVYFDGLNRFYLSELHGELRPALSVPPNVFDEFTLNGSANASFHRLIISRFEKQSAQLRQQLAEQSRLAAAELSSVLKREKERSEYLADAAQAAARSREVAMKRELDLLSELVELQKNCALELAQRDREHADNRLANETRYADQLRREALQNARLQSQAIELQARIRDLESAATLRDHEICENLQRLQQQHAAELRERENSAAKAAAELRNELLHIIEKVKSHWDDVNFSVASTRRELDELKKSWLWRLLVKRRPKESIAAK